MMQLFLIPIFIVSNAWALASPMSEVSVTLFGQPCLLNGPLDKATLKNIHAISPEQVYPPDSPLDSPTIAADPTRRSLEKIRNAANIPSVFDRYREKLGKRLEAQLAFLDGLTAAKKNNTAEPLLVLVKRFPQGKRIKDFEILARKPDAFKNKEISAQLFELFNDSIEPDPEEEFHRAIRQINVHYTCVFGEDSESGDLE